MTAPFVLLTMICKFLEPCMHGTFHKQLMSEERIKGHTLALPHISFPLGRAGGGGIRGQSPEEAMDLGKLLIFSNYQFAHLLKKKKGKRAFIS